ncbi:bifunctional folylpolyglutamate synthase/dihydrofolate synthase [Alicyclobacillus contaminans]|uniref:bifunctional folylpolyglutamate synthase/dihydrofolate synthase n=1 Tax=Alicyclobacillus contaminans TaxID=392016 RepID=UPI00146FB46A|nr:bifunctional folylpolyglutamate synthase/dihydrofolate synthase [Alicyclobacillus contaminans]
MLQDDAYIVETTYDAIHWIYTSFLAVKASIAGKPDCEVRHPEWTSHLLERFGRPDKYGYNVAVTGSKGKGSHAILLAGMLQKLGFRVGLFTGPHLVDFMERFRVNGRIMPESSFRAYIQQVRSEVNRVALPDGQYFGPVGLLAVVAALWFRDERTDVNIFELGRGALHDDVNRIHHEGAVVAPVFLEHARELGPTLADVAREKAGIITSDTRWVCSHPQSDVVQRALLARAGAERAAVRSLGAQIPKGTVAGDVLTLSYPEAQYRITLPFADGFMAQNASVAFDAARQVWRRLREGERLATAIDLSQLRLPGRLQVLADKPLTVLDGTIHAESAVYLRQWVAARRRGRAGKVVAVVSVPADKDGEGVIRELSQVVDKILLTTSGNPHLRYHRQLYDVARRYHAACDWFEQVQDALTRSRLETTAEDLLVFAGTQSFVGDVLKRYPVDTRTLWADTETERERC